MCDVLMQVRQCDDTNRTGILLIRPTMGSLKRRGHAVEDTANSAGPL